MQGDKREGEVGKLLKRGWKKKEKSKDSWENLKEKGALLSCLFIGGSTLPAHANTYRRAN